MGHPKVYRFGDSENYTEIESNGFIHLHGTSRAWKSMDLNPVSIGKPTSNPPAIDEYLGFVFDRYDRGTEEQVYYIWTVPEDFSEGDGSARSAFGFFVENPPLGSGNEAVILGFDYKKITPGDVFSFAGALSGSITETILDGEAAYNWHKTAYEVCTTTGWEYEDIILFRFFRDATNINDTYDNELLASDNDAWVGVYHLEYLRNKFGARS